MRNHSTQQARYQPEVPSSLALAIAGAIAFAGIGACGQWLHGLPTWLEVAAVALAVTVGWASTSAAALSIALFTWALINGFVLNRFGQLTWHGRTDLTLGLWLLTGASVSSFVRQLTWDLRHLRASDPASPQA